MPQCDSQRTRQKSSTKHWLPFGYCTNSSWKLWLSEKVEQFQIPLIIVMVTKVSPSCSYSNQTVTNVLSTVFALCAGNRTAACVVGTLAASCVLCAFAWALRSSSVWAPRNSCRPGSSRLFRLGSSQLVPHGRHCSSQADNTPQNLTSFFRLTPFRQVQC